MNDRCIQLTSGEFTTDQRLDRVKQVDLRSLMYPVASVLALEEPVALSVPRSFSWSLDERLDQGSEGACVGFGWAAELAARPSEIQNVTDAFARDRIYFEAQKIDEWEGGAYPGASPVYEGTSVLAGAKIVQRLGYIQGYDWALHMNDLIGAVGYRGPAVIGVDWYNGMFNTDAEGFISAHGSISGGHCICIYGVRVVRADRARPVGYDNIDMMNSFFRLQNSWGSNWGIDGRCKIRFVDMLKLWPGGDFCIPRGRAAGTPIGFEHPGDSL